jgi:hypothetical protein
MFKKLLITVSLFFFMPLVYAASLTGTWQGNDGGSYYVRQVGSEVWWFGENLPSFSNVAYGKISGDKLILTWGDVPKGSIASSGILVLKVTSSNRLDAVSKTGGFSGSVWTK